MKVKGILLFMLYFCLCSCNMKRQKLIASTHNISFVVDTNLQREYLDVKSFKEFGIANERGTIFSAEAAFNIVEPHINSLIEEDIIASQQVFHIALINDSIWIIKGEPISKANELIFGGAVYYEIRKCDGYLLKCIVEE